jgi:hypothetical protein
MFACGSEKLASLIFRIKWLIAILDVIFRLLYLGSVKIVSEDGKY